MTHLPLMGDLLLYFWSLFVEVFLDSIAVGSSDVIVQLGTSPLLSFWRVPGSLNVWLIRWLRSSKTHSVRP